MCQVCRHNPCHPRCPYAEPTIVHHCTMCGAEIYEGDEYYDIGGDAICEDCIENARREAEL